MGDSPNKFLDDNPKPTAPSFGILGSERGEDLHLRPQRNHGIATWPHRKHCWGDYHLMFH